MILNALANIFLPIELAWWLSASFMILGIRTALITLIYRRCKYLYPIGIVIAYASCPKDLVDNIIVVLALGLWVRVVTTIKDDDDDDFWKRLKEKVSGVVAQVGSKLVVVPTH